MADQKQDAGVITTLAERLTHFRLPRAMDIKAKVDKGEPLDELDIRFLQDVFDDAQTARSLLARHPELEDIASKVVALYHEITSKALENEQKQKK
jgi:hypothetical protein